MGGLGERRAAGVELDRTVEPQPQKVGAKRQPGLLDKQVQAVKQAYARQGVLLLSSSGGEWPCLRLVKRRRYGWRRPGRPNLTTSQPPGDFGTW